MLETHVEIILIRWSHDPIVTKLCQSPWNRLQTSYSDNATFKIIIFSFARKSGHLELNSPLISVSSLHLRGRVVTKRRNIKNFVKSQALFDVPSAVCPDVSDRFAG